MGVAQRGREEARDEVQAQLQRSEREEHRRTADR
jgi:hypothetical protein